MCFFGYCYGCVLVDVYWVVLVLVFFLLIDIYGLVMFEVLVCGVLVVVFVVLGLLDVL